MVSNAPPLRNVLLVGPRSNAAKRIGFACPFLSNTTPLHPHSATLATGTRQKSFRRPYHEKPCMASHGPKFNGSCEGWLGKSNKGPGIHVVAQDLKNAWRPRHENRASGEVGWGQRRTMFFFFQCLMWEEFEEEITKLNAISDCLRVRGTAVMIIKIGWPQLNVHQPRSNCVAGTCSASPSPLPHGIGNKRTGQRWGTLCASIFTEKANHSG